MNDEKEAIEDDAHGGWPADSVELHTLLLQETDKTIRS